jgi:formylglycine-generating enzyme required for sulfatase activity
MYGIAYSKLPEAPNSWSREQEGFIEKAVLGLSQDQKVISVQIAIFADMMRNRDWSTSALREVGGIEGVGVTFLEEMFGSRHAPIAHRKHKKAVQGTLAALLPAIGTDIKGSMQSAEALQAAAGYQDKPREFNELIDILDKNLRLITPVDKEIEEEKPTFKSYQLAHDYMVKPLRQWLTQKQKETREGRARLILADRAAAWSVKEESKQLPTLIEWLQIRRFTEPTKWKAGEESVMREADRYHITRTFVATTFALGLVLAGLGIKVWNDQRLMDRDASNIVRTIEAADFAKLADELKKLSAIRAVVDPKLKATLELTKPDSEERLKFSLALLPSDPGQVDFLVKKLQSAQASQVQLIIDQLRPHREKILESLWLAIEGDNKSSWLPVASALADYDPKNQRWLGVTAKVTDSMVRDPLRASKWIELLRPAATQLNPELTRIYNATPDTLRSQAQIDLAAEILQMYAADDFSLLHELILSGESGQFVKLFDEYEVFREKAVTQLRIDVAKEFVADSKESREEVEQSRLQWIARQANAAVALMRLEDTQPVYQFLTVDNDPDALSQFIYRIRGREVSPSLLVKSFRDLARVSTSSDTLERRRNNLKLYGFILGLGEFTVDQLPTTERDGFIAELKALYSDHPSRAVHSALSWLLRRWGQQEYVKAIDETRLEYDPKGIREWYVVQVNPTISKKSEDESSESGEVDNQLADISAPIYFTMLVIPGGSFEMGEGLEAETVDIKGPIAVSDREVTWRQFSPFDRDLHRLSWEKQFQKELGGRKLRPEEPAFGVSWFEAVAYCRWLTEELMPGEENQSYDKKDWTAEQAPIRGWLEIPDQKDWEWPLDPTRPGFRLLTENEWEYVARGGTETEYSFGKDPALLSEYAWYEENSAGWSHPVAGLRPSVAGLFDIHGNLWEWTDDWHTRGSDRVLRGGSWNDDAASCRSADRESLVPSLRTNDYGFRLALSLPSGVPSPAEQGEEKGAETAGGGTEGAKAEPRPEMP